jgi:hypothetical protein
MVPQPIDSYGIAKYAGELDLKVAYEQHGLEYCIIRPHNVYGPGQNIWDPYRNVLGIWTYQALFGKPMTIYGDGMQKRAFSYIDDMMQPLLNAALSDKARNEIINLGGMKETSLLEAAQLLANVTGHCAMQRLEERHEVKYAWSTYQKSVDLLDYKETVDLQEGLRRMCVWVTEQPHRVRKYWPKYELEKGLYSFWNHKYCYTRPSWIGIGNLFLHLALLYKSAPYISKNVLENEFGACIELNPYFKVLEDTTDTVQPDTPLWINPKFTEYYLETLPEIIKPTPIMQLLINKHRHLVDDVVFGVNIRRGSYSDDSRQYKDDERALAKDQLFCDDKGLSKFMALINMAPGRVYVSSDSPSTKQNIKDYFGDKVTMLDTEFVHTSDEDYAGKKTKKNLQEVFLVWFLLSMCPMVYITGGVGNNSNDGVSTFGYTAALYGKKHFEAVSNA